MYVIHFHEPTENSFITHGIRTYEVKKLPHKTNHFTRLKKHQLHNIKIYPCTSYTNPSVIHEATNDTTPECSSCTAHLHIQYGQPKDKLDYCKFGGSCN